MAPRQSLLAAVLALVLVTPARATPTYAPLAKVLVSTQPTPDTKREPVRSATTLRAGDQLQVLVTAWRSAYVHVLHVASSGTVHLLMRSTEPVARGRSIRLPRGGPEQAYVLDGTTGRETIVVIVSEAPLATADHALDAELSYLSVHGQLAKGSGLAAAIEAKIRACSEVRTHSADRAASRARLSNGTASSPSTGKVRPLVVHEQQMEVERACVPGIHDLEGATRGPREADDGALLAHPNARGVALVAITFQHVH